MVLMSFWEKILKREMIYLFWKNNVIWSYRPDFLKNPKTWQNLEIDVFVNTWKIQFWIEFQWWQHYTDKEQIWRDEYKYKICKQKWIQLYRVNLKWLYLFLKKIWTWIYTQEKLNFLKQEIWTYLENVSKKYKKDVSLKKTNPKQKAIKSIKKDVNKTFKNQKIKKS